MMSEASWPITKSGWRGWRPTRRPASAGPEAGWHNRTGEDNADAHLKGQVMGREVVVAVTKGRLDFGAWERIFYGEFAATAGSGGSGCWSRLLGSSGNQSYPGSHGVWHTTATVAKPP